MAVKKANATVLVGGTIVSLRSLGVSLRVTQEFRTYAELSRNDPRYTEVIFMGSKWSILTEYVRFDVQ